jgi:hypothetical protein
MYYLSCPVRLFGHVMGGSPLKNFCYKGTHIHLSGGIQTYYPSVQVAKTHALRRAVTAAILSEAGLNSSVLQLHK